MRSMRSTATTLDFSKKLLLAGIATMLLSVSSLNTLTEDVFAAPDKFGIEQIYPTANGGPVWFLNNEEPEEDENFLMTSHEDIGLEVEEEEEEESGVFKLDAETGTQKHGVRIHADSPDDKWKNVEMTGYFKLEEGDDQFTLVARQGPTYNDDGGCGAYGYYGMLSADGDAFFRKKLFHHGGYSDRAAEREGVIDNLQDRWVGIKLVVYNLDGGNVKLELWVDDGDETNNWQKATEYVDGGNWDVGSSDCGRPSDDIIEEGTRGAFRVDNSAFEFKKLSIREIEGSGEVAEAALMEEGEAAADEEEEEAAADEEEEEAAADEEEEGEGGAADEEGDGEGGAAALEEEEGEAADEEEEEAAADEGEAAQAAAVEEEEET